MAPGDGNSEETRALAREVGRHSVERLGDGLTRIIGETSALYRWVLTMLVLLNGGALYFALLLRETIGPERFGGALLLFFAGLLAAVGAALAGIVFTMPVARSIRRAIMVWTDVSVSGELSQEAIGSARWVKRMGAIWLSVTALIVLASLALFLWGATMIGDGLGIGAGETQVPAEAVVPVVAAPVVNEVGAVAAAPVAGVPAVAPSPASQSGATSRAAVPARRTPSPAPRSTAQPSPTPRATPTSAPTPAREAPAPVIVPQTAPQPDAPTP
jgi:hypothetical protein